METLLIYIVKVNIALVVFYLLYMLLFSKDTFIRLRRYYFLSAIVFALSYPLFTVSALGNLIDAKQETVATSVYIGEISMGEVVMEEVEEAATPIDWIAVAKNVLLLGTIVLGLRLLSQLLSIIRIKSKSKKRTLFHYLFYQLKDEMTPFSFFNWIFIHADSHNENELKQILLHEHTHVSQWHSIDILLVELLRVIFWWNPIVWLMKRDIAINLEYLADEAVLQKGVETTEYQYHLLQLTYQETAVQIVNNFNVSQLKQRIIMMNKNKTPIRKLAKYLSIIPLVLLLIAANSMHAQTNETQEPAKEIAPPPPPPPPPPPHKQELVSYKKNLTAIMEFIKTEMNYPLIAKENGIQGRVLASFTVEKDGTVTNPKIVEGVDPSLDKEAIRIIKAMPKWEPFVQDGKTNKTEYTIPFHFDLDGKEKSNESSIVGFKVINAEEGGDAKIIGSGEMKDKPVQTLAEKFGDNKPTYFVDGEKTEDIEHIDPKDIESISVLKDKSAIEKFGEEGRNGVIEITTKPSYKNKNKLMDTAREKLANNPDEVFVVVEDQPQFPGGTEALMKYLGDNKPIYFVDGEKTVDIEHIDPKDIESISVLKDKSAIEKFGEVGKNGVIEITTKPSYKAKNKLMDTARKKLEGEKEEVFVVVEDQPQFPGGMSAMMKYLSNNIEYPVEAQKNKIEGRVIVNFVVEKDGTLSEFNVVRGQDPLLDAEAIRVISTMPKWKPGMQRGEAVRVRFTLPIVFRLQKNESNKEAPLNELKGEIKTIKHTDIKEEQKNLSMVARKDQSIVTRKDQKTDSKFYKFISERIKYPVIAQENGITGVVRASYDVNSSGTVSNIKITKGADPSLDAELKRIIQLMPGDVALMRSEGKAASNVALSANFIFGDAKMKEVRSEESDFIVMGYRNSTN